MKYASVAIEAIIASTRRLLRRCPRSLLACTAVAACLGSASAFTQGQDEASKAETNRQHLERFFDFVVGGSIIDTLCQISDPDLPETLWNYTRFEAFVADNGILNGQSVEEHYRDTVPSVHANLPDCDGKALEISANWKGLLKDLNPFLGLDAYTGPQSDRLLSQELFAATLLLVAVEEECRHLPPDRRALMHRHLDVAYSFLTELYGEAFVDREITRFVDNGGRRPQIGCDDSTAVERVTIAGMRKVTDLNLLLARRLGRELKP